MKEKKQLTIQRNLQRWTQDTERRQTKQKIDEQPQWYKQ